MNATINAPCACPEAWPARECDRHDDPPASYVSPILILGGITAIGYTALGAAFILLGRLAWNVARGLAGGGW